ncbi:MAG TPA: 6-phosphogluconolactonase [Candidatus Peribacterales bacterium]|nr:6-phosphogluconolactonase [Candidatus Peribacterales bacterium]
MMAFSYKHIPVDSIPEFIDRSSAELEQVILDAIEEKGSCILGLSGGSTPHRIYEALGELKSIDWSAVKIFLVDERYVPEDHAESNQKMIRETLLKHASIPERQIIFPDTTLALEECVEDYDFRIDQLMEEGIDVVALGLGEDGHIASLFPGDIDALLEKERRVIHTQTDVFAIHDRITVTLTVLESAAHPLFFLQGTKKKKIFAEALSENEDSVEYPAHALLSHGNTVWVTQW